MILRRLPVSALEVGFGSQAFMLYQNGLYSRDVANDLSKRQDIMRKAFYHQWDSASQQWAQPSPFVSTTVALMKGALGIPVRAWEPPDGALLQEYIIDNVKLDVDPQKPIVTITFRHQDPQFAVEFLNALDRTVDEKLRQDALERANQYVNFLSDQLKSVTNTDVREALVSTLADQEKIKMMASATAPYAAQPFGLPSASRKPTNPNPILVLVAAAFAGLLLAIIAAFWLPLLRWPSVRLRNSPGTTTSSARR